MDKKQSQYCSRNQKDTLVELLQTQEYSVLLSGKFTANFTFKDAQEKWKEISSILNSIPGCNKDWKHWRKTWQDIRSKTKKRHVDNTKYAGGTGGGPRCKSPLNDREEKIISMINPTEVLGNENIVESCIDFNFEDNIIESQVHSPGFEAPASKTDGNSNVILYSNLEDTNISGSDVDFGASTSNDDGNRVSLKCNKENTIPVTQVDHLYCKSKKQNITAKQTRNIPTRNQRLKESVLASRQLAYLGKEKLECKKDYFNKKLSLMERQVIALENLVECLKK